MLTLNLMGNSKSSSGGWETAIAYPFKNNGSFVKGVWIGRRTTNGNSVTFSTNSSDASEKDVTITQGGASGGSAGARSVACNCNNVLQGTGTYTFKVTYTVLSASVSSGSPENILFSLEHRTDTVPTPPNYPYLLIPKTVGTHTVSFRHYMASSSPYRSFSFNIRPVPDNDFTSSIKLAKEIILQRKK